jgi:hypothetical protein
MFFADVSCTDWWAQKWPFVQLPYINYSLLLFENNLTSVMAKRGTFLPTTHKLTLHIKAKKCTQKNYTMLQWILMLISSSSFHFFFSPISSSLPTSSSSFHFFFFPISSFLSTVNVGLAVAHGQPLQVTL